MKIHLSSGVTINRARVIVVDGDTDAFLCGLIAYDGGRYLKVVFTEGQWTEHPTEWRIFDSVAAAQARSWKVSQNAIDIAEELASM